MIYRCSDDVPFITADDFEKNLRYVLDEIHSKMPRVFVNLVEVFNVSLVRCILYSIEHFGGKESS